MLSTTRGAGRNCCEPRLGAGLGAGTRGDHDTPTCQEQGLPTAGAACQGTQGRDVAVSPIQGRNSRTQHWKRAQQGFTLSFPLPATAADVALREGHGQDIPPGQRNQPREGKTTSLLCLHLCLLFQQAQRGGGPGGHVQPLCLERHPRELPSGLAQVTRNGTPQPQWAAPRRDPIHNRISQTIFFPILPPHALLLGY